jgi:hypothetical protein
MLARVALLTTIAVFASTATLAGAAGKGEPAHVKPYAGPVLSVKPLKGRPNAPLTISGTRFAASKKLHTEIDCPMFPSKGQPLHGRWTYTATTSANGSFTLHEKFPALKNAKSGTCNVYVLNTAKKGSFWISTGFGVS